MLKVRCSILIEVEDDVWKKQGYENLNDYLNDCKFCVYNHEHEDICVSVEDYQKIN